MGVAKKADGWHPIDAADSRQPQFIERKANCLSMRASSGDFVPGRVELGGTPSVKGQGLRPTWVDHLAHSRTCCSCIEALDWGRSQENRVGKESVSTCISRSSAYHYKKKHMRKLYINQTTH